MIFYWLSLGLSHLELQEVIVVEVVVLVVFIRQYTIVTSIAKSHYSNFVLLCKGPLEPETQFSLLLAST